MAEDKPKIPYHEQVAAEMIKALENGTAPWIKPWEPGAPSGGPVNALTGKPYRGINYLRLGLMQYGMGSDDDRWCTYKQAKELGAQVKRGARGVLVQYWKREDKKLLRDGRGKPILDDKGKKQYEVTKLDRPQVFHAVVFHASQIENLPPLPPKPELKPEAAFERHERSEKLLQASGAAIFHDQANRAFYRPATDEIHLPKREQFHTPDGYYATALHELGHWTGHESRLTRELVGHPYGSGEYAREELRAEIASYMLGMELGIGHDPGQHQAYVASWIEALKKDPKEIIRAARDADQIKEYVLGLEKEKTAEIEGELEQEPEAATFEEAVMETGGGIGMLAAVDGQGREYSVIAPNEDNASRGHLIEIFDRNAEQKRTFLQCRESPGWSAQEARENAATLAGLQNRYEEAKGRYDELMDGAAYPEESPELMRCHERMYRSEREMAVFKEQIMSGRGREPAGNPYSKGRGGNEQVVGRPNDGRRERPAPVALDPRQEFGKALQDAGLVIEGEPVMDGKIQRVPVVGGRPGARDGAYCGYADGRPNGWYQNHKTGERGKWLATGHVLTREAKERLRDESAAKLAAREAERQVDQDKAMRRAYGIWMHSEPVRGQDHPYLQEKGVEAFGLRRDKNGNLLVPGYDLETGRLMTLEHIGPDGKKGYEKGCPKQGAVGVIPDRDALKTGEVVLMVEGYATGASVHQATGLPVAVAFDAGNIKEAAMAIKRKMPHVKLTICADNDAPRIADAKNIGVIKAKEAAAAIPGCKVVVADFSKSEKERGLTDFNDLHKARGLGAVRDAVLGRPLQQEPAEIER